MEEEEEFFPVEEFQLGRIGRLTMEKEYILRRYKEADTERTELRVRLQALEDKHEEDLENTAQALRDKIEALERKNEALERKNGVLGDTVRTFIDENKRNADFIRQQGLGIQEQSGVILDTVEGSLELAEVRAQWFC